MSIVQMSLNGTVLILAVVVLRALAINRLPKDTFLILWGIVLMRLTVPFSVPSGFSVYSWLQQYVDWKPSVMENTADLDMENAEENDTYVINGNPVQSAVIRKSAVKNDRAVMNQSQSVKKEYAVCFVLWSAGMLACMIYFSVSYLRCRFEFQTALPVENPFVQRWLAEHPRRIPAVRQSDQISTPLTYGIWRPVILMPKNTDWENTQQLEYILMHEYVHICRCDALTKLFCTYALCVHWFNPFVWIMYLFFNRDVEISCDEHVVRRLGEHTKSVYARVLIEMEAQRSSGRTALPLGNGFLLKAGDNAMEERIRAIMKIKKKSLPAAVLAAVIIISMTAAFATSAAESKTNKTIQKSAGYTAEEYEKLLALRLEGYDAMYISDYQEAVWKLTDNQEYVDLLERFALDETLYAVYEGKKEADKNTVELAAFFYNIFEPLTAEKWQSRYFSGAAATDFRDASDNAMLEYTVTLTIRDADQLTVGEYDMRRRHVMEDLAQIFQAHEWQPMELRDEKQMFAILDEEMDCIKSEWSDERLEIEITYYYTPLGELPADEMEGWQQDRFDEWNNAIAPYLPFGLTFQYDQRIDEFRMYLKGKEVRAIYDTGCNLLISARGGVGADIYAGDAIDLYTEYDGRELVGLREATPEEMAEATKKRREQTEGNQEIFTMLREDVPATEEDYQSLLTLKTPDYRSKTIAKFNAELLDWTEHHFEQSERIAVDIAYEDYRVALTEEEKAFAAVTAYFSRMENAADVRSIQKQEPVRDVVGEVCLRAKEDFDPGSRSSVWCSLYYSFSYHISDQNRVSIGERDDCIGGMMDSIQKFWESSTAEQLVSMTEEEVLETLHAIAAKYSSRSIAVTILEDQTAFEADYTGSR